MSRFDFLSAVKFGYIFICTKEPTKAANAVLSFLLLPQTSKYPVHRSSHIGDLRKEGFLQPQQRYCKKSVKSTCFTESAKDSTEKNIPAMMTGEGELPIVREFTAEGIYESVLAVLSDEIDFLKRQFSCLLVCSILFLCTVSVQNPVCIIAKLKGDKFGEGRRNGFILFRIRSTVACKNIHIIYSNTKSAGKLSFGYILFAYNLVQSI